MSIIDVTSALANSAPGLQAASLDYVFKAANAGGEPAEGEADGDAAAGASEGVQRVRHLQANIQLGCLMIEQGEDEDQNEETVWLTDNSKEDFESR